MGTAGDTVATVLKFWYPRRKILICYYVWKCYYQLSTMIIEIEFELMIKINKLMA